MLSIVNKIKREKANSKILSVTYADTVVGIKGVSGNILSQAPEKSTS